MAPTSPPNEFQTYANSYDALYADKDYEAECDFLEPLFHRFGPGDVRTILDMGCGTGGHAIPLARRGYEVFGIDRSEPMLAIARQKAKESGLSEKIHLEEANVQQFNLNRTFDAVICMFAVLGYQTTNQALFSTLRAARSHIEKGGLFICDFWYGPAVLNQRPSERIKTVRDGENRIIRIVKPKLSPLENTVDVDYHVITLRGDRLTGETREMHKMRYIFKPEIDFFLARAGFRLDHFCPFPEFEKKADESTWNVTAVASAV